MVEGGGLGTLRARGDRPDRHVQSANGVVDVQVADEAEAVAATKRLLSYFQGPVAEWTAPDQEALRELVPERRRRAYDVRGAVRGLADSDSVTVLREGFAPEMVTALARIEGRPVGRRSPTTRCGSQARSPATAPTRPRASCSSATRSGSRSSR